MSLFAHTKENRLICFMMRLSPIPYGLQNSLFAVTDISYQKFIFSTWIGLLPFQLLWTHFGTTMASLSSEENNVSTSQIFSLMFQLFVMAALFWYLYKMMRIFKRNVTKDPVSIV